MTRLAPLLLAFVLVACDAEAPLTPAASDAPTVTLAASKSADEAYPILRDAAVRATGETVMLRVNGQTIEMEAGQAYLIGEALTRASYDVLPSGLQEGISIERRPGVRCYPSEGFAVLHDDGRMTKRCPPPPPRYTFGEDVYAELLGRGGRLIEVPEGVEWRQVPGGFVADAR